MISIQRKNVDFRKIYYNKHRISIFLKMLTTLKIINILKSFWIRFKGVFRVICQLIKIFLEFFPGF